MMESTFNLQLENERLNSEAVEAAEDAVALGDRSVEAAGHHGNEAGSGVKTKRRNACKRRATGCLFKKLCLLAV